MARKDRLQLQIASAEQNWRAVNDIVTRLEGTLTRETRESERFRLEEEIKPLRARRQELAQELDRLEADVQKTEEEAQTAVLSNYLKLTHTRNGFIKVPGISEHVAIEKVWVQPTFKDGSSATQLFKVLADRAVLIIAPAGAGKSTFGQFFATSLAKDREDFAKLGAAANSWQLRYFGVAPGANTEFPLFIRLVDISVELGDEGVFKAATPTPTSEEIAELKALATQRNLTFILDGLDEVEPERRVKVVEIIQRMKHRWEGCYFIVTTRHDDTFGLSGQGFRIVTLNDLSRDAGLLLFKKLATVLVPDISKAEEFVQKIGSALARSPDSWQIATTPLAASFLCWTFFVSGRLPIGKASLYKGVTEWLLASRAGLRIAAHVDIETLNKVLEAIAFILLRGTAAKGPTSSIHLDNVIVEVSRLLQIPRDEVERIIRVESTFGSCLARRSSNSVGFWHLNLRDYFAARWLLRGQRHSGEAITEEFRNVIDASAWEQCVEMFIGLLTLEEVGLVQPLLDGIEFGSESELTAIIQKLSIQSRLFEIASAHGFEPRLGFEARLRTELASIADITDEQLTSITPEERISAFSAFRGRFLDPRLSGKPAKRALPLVVNGATLMGRYPVTVQEFSRFVKQGGYDDLRWSRDYQSVMRGLSSPHSWSEQLSRPNAPVVGVSWHEASAYCRWLQSEMGAQYEVRLPTIEEWSCAIGKSGVHLKDLPSRVAPVGLFPERRGPNGHDDLGLIWEWIGPKVDFAGPRRRRKIITLVKTTFARKRGIRGRARAENIGFRTIFVQNQSILSTNGG